MRSLTANQAAEPTRDSAFGFAFVGLAFWSGVPQFHR
jgi:hypothetical protein